MRDNLSPEFIAELSRQGCSPVQVAIFKFSTGNRALSDRVFEYAPGLYTEDLIESWGDMPRTANTAETLAGSGVPIPSCALTILNIGPDWFSGQISGITLEEVEVELWQYFRGIDDSYLIDRFVIQDNFQHGQGHLTLSLDLVSPLLASDPYIGTLDPVSNTYLGVPIGLIIGVPGILYGVNPYAKLDISLTGAETTIITDRDLLTADFVAPGSIEIGVNIVNYTGISGNNFTGCSRVASGAGAGQYITKVGHDYIFAFGAGPVSVAGPVYVDGESYTGDRDIRNDLNPVQVAFPDRLPGELAKPPSEYIDATLFNDYAEAALSIAANTGDVTIYCDRDLIEAGFVTPSSTIAIIDGLDGFFYTGISGNNFTGCSGVNGIFPVGAPVTMFWQSGSSLSVQVQPGDTTVYCDLDLFSAGFPAAGGFAQIYTNPGFDKFSYTGIAGNNFTGCSGIESTVSAGARVTQYSWMYTLPPGEIFDSSNPKVNGVPIGRDRFFYDSAVLDDLRVIIDYSLVKDGDEVEVRVSVFERSSSINVTLSIGDSESSDVSPADLIISMISKNKNLIIDQASFDAARIWFNDNGYVFNGFIPGDQRLLKTLLDMCQQCRSTLIHDNGYLYLKVNGISSQSSMLFWSERENTVAKNSIQVSRQRAEDTKNWIDVRYDTSDIQAGYQGGFTIKDQQSIDKQGRLQGTLDLYLIDDQVMANDIASYYLTDRKTPYTIITFKTYTEGFPLQIGDTVTLITRYSGFIIFKGRVVDTSPSFGSWKQKKMYHYNVTIAGYLPAAGDSGSTGHGAGLHGVQPHGL